MKIIIVSDAIYPYNKGGKEKRIFEISGRLARRGHEVHIYCMKWWKGRETTRVENGVNLHAICNYYPLYSGTRRSIREAIMFSLSCLKLIKEDFDVIDVDHMPHLVLFPIKLICVLKRKKMIATWQEVWGLRYWKKYLGMFGYMAYVIEYVSAKLPNQIIAISEHTKKKLLHELNVKSTIVVITSGINFSEIQRVTPSKKKTDVIYAGRLLGHKNVDVLIRSIAILRKTYPNIKCFIIGEGPVKIQLEKLVDRLHLTSNVLFLDYFDDHKELYALMKSSKVFVFPSTREGFGMVVIEANACGIPVITTNDKDNASKDIIEEGKNGYICHLDEEDIAEGITKILKNNSSITMKQYCIKLAYTYSLKELVNKIEKVYLQ